MTFLQTTSGISYILSDHIQFYDEEPNLHWSPDGSVLQWHHLEMNYKHLHKYARSNNGKEKKNTN